MKKLVLFLSFMFASNSFAINLSSFNDKNFDPIGGRKCGIHLETAGTTLIVTDIVPPRKDADQFCRQYGSDCGGRSFDLNCDKNGRCKNGDGETHLILLPDGNVYSAMTGTKFLRSPEFNYFWCVD